MQSSDTPNIQIFEEIPNCAQKSANIIKKSSTWKFETKKCLYALQHALECGGDFGRWRRGDSASSFFTPYLQQVELARGISVELPTYEDEDFQIDIKRLESLITKKTKALILNSPSNPTGNCLTMETMQKIAEAVTKHDLIVIADDIYTSFSYQNAFVPFAKLPGMRERTIIINSFSKNLL